MRVIVYTQGYNCERTLEKTVESVLNQTYRNFEYHFEDNGSTDSSGAILHRYAQQDPRLVIHTRELNHLITKEMNRIFSFFQSISSEDEDTYLAVIDADDWWEENYLERMISFLEDNDLDIAVTGTIAYLEREQREQILRKLDIPTIMTQEEFAQKYPYFWAFPSTYWGSIMKSRLFQNVDFENIFKKIPFYGMDTILILEYIKNCRRIGIDNSALYHYRIHESSEVHRYVKSLESKVGVYEFIKAFLELHNTFDTSKQEWLKRVHITSLNSMLDLLRKSSLSAAEKIAECAQIVSHPLTEVALTNDCNERKQWYALIKNIVCSNLAGAENTDDLKVILKKISPCCEPAVTADTVPLFVRETGLLAALMKNDRDKLLAKLFALISEKKYTKQFDLGAVLGSVIPEKTLLSGITDIRFFRTYAQSCQQILTEEYAGALDTMTGILLEKDKLYGEETFLTIYLSLAALENEIPAFLYGNVRLADFYLCEKRYEECRTVLDDLTEMGAGEHEDVVALREQLAAFH